MRAAANALLRPRFLAPNRGCVGVSIVLSGLADKYTLFLSNGNEGRVRPGVVINRP